MEQEIKKFISDHRKEIALVGLTVLFMAKFAPRKNVAYIQDFDGSYWVQPVRKK